MKFVKFTEHNDNEGEDWNFWLQLDDNYDQLKTLEAWLGTFDDEGLEYEIDMTPVEEFEVDILVKHTDEGYMAYENKVVGKFTCPEVTDENEDDGWMWLDDNFYKGKIKDFFKE